MTIPIQLFHTIDLARAVVAVFFSIITGLLMAIIFRKEDASRTEGQIYVPDPEATGRRLFQDTLYIFTMVLILIFAAIAKPSPQSTGIWPMIFAAKWYITAGLLVILFFMLKMRFTKDECKSWVASSWDFMKQIFPLRWGWVYWWRDLC